MEFFDLRRGVSITESQPVIQTTAGNVLLTLPMALAEHLGLSGAAAVKVQFGAAGDTSALKIKADEQGGWPLHARRTKVQIYIPEIQPEGKVERQAVPYEEADGAVVLTLPAPWKLANPLALRRAPSPAAGRRKT